MPTSKRKKSDVYVVKRALADGTVREYHYVGRGRGAVRIQAAPGSADYHRELAAALDRKADSDPGKLGGLIARYKAAPEFHKLKPGTQADYRRYLDLIHDEFGAMRLSAVAARGARTLILDWRDSMASTPRAADMAMSVFRRVLSWAEQREEIARNPLREIDALHHADRADVIWEPAELAALLAHCRPDTRRAVALLAHTGLRRGDLCGRLTWASYNGSTIKNRPVQ